MNTVQEKWDSFSLLVVPKDASPVQRQEMRRAFYAGAEAMMQIQWAVGAEDISEDAGIHILEGCRSELQGFVEQVVAGEA